MRDRQKKTREVHGKGEWLSARGAVDGETLWYHIEAACGYFRLRDADFPDLDTCQIYWNNKELS